MRLRLLAGYFGGIAALALAWAGTALGAGSGLVALLCAGGMGVMAVAGWRATHLVLPLLARSGQAEAVQERLEDQVRRVQQGRRLQRELLASMSHDLRTPLNGIIGFAELLHDGKVGALSATQKEYLGDILASAQNLCQIVDGLLELTRMEAGQMEARGPLWGSAPAGATPPILVVADDLRERAWLAWQLAERGHTPEVATGAQRALLRGRQQRFAAIVLSLPRADIAGEDFLRAIRGAGCNRATPVIVVAEQPGVAGAARSPAGAVTIPPRRSAALFAALERAGVLPGKSPTGLVVDAAAYTLTVAAAKPDPAGSAAPLSPRGEVLDGG
jgi:signal transduction histidine kinase